jgi:hypothetical protein
MPVDGVPGRRDHDLSVSITVRHHGSESADDARETLGLLCAAIGTDNTFSGLAYDTLLNRGSIEFNNDQNEYFTDAVLDIVIRYRTDLWSI